MAAPPPRPARLFAPRLLARGTPHRRHPARPRPSGGAAAGRRGGARARLGELARGATPTPPSPDVRSRPGRAAPGPDLGASGPPTGCWRSSSSSPGWSSSASSSPVTCATRAGPRCRSRPRSAAWSLPGADLRRGQPRPAAGPRRLGDPDRHRHRLRPGRARRDRHPPADGAAHVPAHPRGGRRPARDHHHRGLLHRATCTALPLLLAAGAAGAVRRARPAPGPLLVAAAAAGRGDLGAGARVRRARHRRRGAARLHRAR